MDETSYTPYVITITIPNVRCERCSLQLTNPMTDKIGNDGAPSGIGCTDPNGTCFSVYHSCTKPFKIVGNVSTGAVPRDEYICPNTSSNSDWPTSWIGDDGLEADASVSGVYRRISSVWSTDDFTLTTVPELYTKDTGDICKVGIGSSSSSVSGIVDEPENEDFVESNTSENVAVMEDEMIVEEEEVPGEATVSIAEVGMQASSAALQDRTLFMGFMHTVLVVTVKMAL